MKKNKEETLSKYEQVFSKIMADITKILELSLEALEMKDYEEVKLLLNELLFTIDEYKKR